MDRPELYPLNHGHRDFQSSSHDQLGLYCVEAEKIDQIMGVA
ncbi:MAG: hypothetical protein WAU53_03275 [Rhodoplanes sp.]